MPVRGCALQYRRFKASGDAPVLVPPVPVSGGGSSTVNAGFQSADFTVTGELARHEAVADSGNPMVRSFCPACGTPMFSETPARPHLRFIRVGTLDDTSLAKPEMTIWTAEAPDWACIDPDVPRFASQPPPPAVRS